MSDIEKILAALQRSEFRRSKKLGVRDAEYLRNKGIDEITTHARDFIRKRLAPAHPPNDGKQTPWHGHPVFVAQHATATCCRGCLAKWHGIGNGRELTDNEVEYVVAVIRTWIERQPL